VTKAQIWKICGENQSWSDPRQIGPERRLDDWVQRPGKTSFRARTNAPQQTRCPRDRRKKIVFLQHHFIFPGRVANIISMDLESMDVDGPDQELAGASGGDLFYRVARDLAQTSAWQRDLPRHERHVIEAALKSERVWKSLFSSSHEDDGTDSASKSQPSTNSTKRKRGAAAATPKKTKVPASKKKSDKKGTSTSEDGEDTETTHLDVLNSRVRCMVFDAVVDELFPPERYTSDPWADAVRLENGPFSTSLVHHKRFQPHFLGLIDTKIIFFSSQSIIFASPAIRLFSLCMSLCIFCRI
jgi:hypothetical protein